MLKTFTKCGGYECLNNLAKSLITEHFSVKKKWLKKIV